MLERIPSPNSSSRNSFTLEEQDSFNVSFPKYNPYNFIGTSKERTVEHTFGKEAKQVEAELELFGITPYQWIIDPNPEELLRKAYRLKALKTHSDKNQKPNADADMQDLSNRYQAALKRLPQDPTPPSKNPAFERAVREGDYPAVRGLLDADKNNSNLHAFHGLIGRRNFLKERTGLPISNGPILFMAIFLHKNESDPELRKNYLKIVDALAEHAALDSMDSSGMAPLYYAIWQDDSESVNRLLQHGANPNLVTYHKEMEHWDPPVIPATECSSPDIFMELTNHSRFDPHLKYKTSTGETRTLLMAAAETTFLADENPQKAGRIEHLANILLSRNVDPAFQDESKETAFTLAAKNRNGVVVHCLGAFFITQLQKAGEETKPAAVQEAVSRVVLAATDELAELQKNPEKNMEKIYAFEYILRAATQAVAQQTAENTATLKTMIERASGQASFGQKLCGAFLFLAGVLLMGLSIAGTPLSGGLAIALAAGGALLSLSGATLFYFGRERKMAKELRGLHAALEPLTPPLSRPPSA